MSEQEAIEKIAEIIGKYDVVCDLPIECNTDCKLCGAKALWDAGYRLPTEPTEELREKVAKVIYFHGEAEDDNKWQLLRPAQRDMYIRMAKGILALIKPSLIITRSRGRSRDEKRRKSQTD